MMELNCWHTNAYYRLTLLYFFLAVPALGIGAESRSVRLDCAALKMSQATNQRVQLGRPPFSILPPKGENWCSSMLPGGLAFSKVMGTVQVPANKPTQEEVSRIALRAIRFITAATTIPNSGADFTAPGRLKVVVDELISNHFFSQILGGTISAERSFQLLDSQSAPDTSLGVTCVRFGARVEWRTLLFATPVIQILKFLDNKVCIHPRSIGRQSTLVWIGFAVFEGAETSSSEDDISKEVEPFLQSLEFVITG
jgi:hypothetical protein